jgi:hypothetical protein
MTQISPSFSIELFELFYVLASYVLASGGGVSGKGCTGEGMRMVLLVIVVRNVGLSSVGGSWVVVQVLCKQNPIERSV